MYRFVGSLMLAGSLAVLTGGAAAAEAVMSDQEIQTSVIGNTVTGMEDGEHYVEFLSPDGRILGRSRSGAYSGVWRIKTKRLCVSYDGKASWDCAAVRLNGEQVVWIAHGVKFVSAMTKGDAEYAKKAPRHTPKK